MNPWSTRQRSGGVVSRRFLHSLFVGRTVGAKPPSTPETAESSVLPQMVDERPTKHWVSVTVVLDEVSAECRCGWSETIENNRDRPTRIEQASAAARNHTRKATA